MAYIQKKTRTTRKRSEAKTGSRQKVYQSALWRKLRMCKLTESPLCEVCLIEGRTKGGDHVHHLVSFVDVYDEVERHRLAYDPENLLTVCEGCHGRLHGGDLRGCLSINDIKKRLLI